MTFLEAITTCFKKYLTFKGRATRPEYWYWVLFIWLLALAAFAVDRTIFGGAGLETSSRLASNLVNLIILLPTIAVSVRRLHDVNRSGWWFLLTFTVIGVLLLLYWYVSPSKKP